MSSLMSSLSESIERDGMRVPMDRSLPELTTELGALLAEPDAVQRQRAYRILGTWVGTGVYDSVLARLGGGLSGLLREGLGEVATDSVFGRSYAALLVAELVRRDNEVQLLGSATVRDWGESVATWYVAERDLRGFVPGKGWARALGHGADAIGQLARSRHLHRLGLVYLLDLLAERLLVPTGDFLVSGETDRMAAAAMAVLRRDLVDLDALEPWLDRLAERSRPRANGEFNPFLVSGNVQAFLRSLYLQLTLSADRPAAGTDLLLHLVDRLRESNARYLPDPTTLLDDPSPSSPLLRW